MLLTLASWIILFFILFSFGNIFNYLYGKFCNRDENYNTPDFLILGICLITLVLPISSLWFPSNHYMLLLYAVISTLYWLFNIEKLKTYGHKIKTIFVALSTPQRIITTLVLLSIFTCALYITTNYDSACYHYQNIKWNEYYKVIPGLSNIEDRFGFNSNYLLVSAIFTFRFIFDYPIYPLQTFLFLCIFCWTLINIFKSQYDIKHIILFFVLFTFFIVYKYAFSDSDTDIIPGLCILYYIVKTVLYPEWIRKQTLLAFILPVVLVTYKVSTATFCLMSLVIFINLFKIKNYKAIVFLTVCSLVIVGIWCIRNIITSGYLVYPLHEVDLFSFDWKVPTTTTELQNIHIYHWAKSIHQNRKFIFALQLHPEALKYFANYISLIGCFLSLPLIFFGIIKKRVEQNIFIVYSVAFIGIVFTLIFAPDFRFMNGYIFGIIFLALITALSLFKKKITIPHRITNPALITIFSMFLCISAFYIYKKVVTAEDEDEYRTELPKSEKAIKLLQHPFKRIDGTSYNTYNMNGITIYLTKDIEFRTYDILPATDDQGLPFFTFIGHKVQSIKTIECRGNSIEDGFKTKDEYMDILNENKEVYIQDYLNVKYKDQ